MDNAGTLLLPVAALFRLPAFIFRGERGSREFCFEVLLEVLLVEGVADVLGLTVLLLLGRIVFELEGADVFDLRFEAFCNAIAARPCARGAVEAVERRTFACAETSGACIAARERRRGAGFEEALFEGG